MEEAGLLDCLNKEEEQFIYVEYGAGKAGLSHFVSSRLGIKYNEFPDKALGKQMQNKRTTIICNPQKMIVYLIKMVEANENNELLAELIGQQEQRES